jgi:hypothetical protein
LPLINDNNFYENWQNEYSVDIDTRIRLKDLEIPQKPCTTENCENNISINSLTGLCKQCQRHIKKENNNKKDQKPCLSDNCERTIAFDNNKNYCNACLVRIYRKAKKESVALNDVLYVKEE